MGMIQPKGYSKYDPYDPVYKQSAPDYPDYPALIISSEPDPITKYLDAVSGPQAFLSAQFGSVVGVGYGRFVVSVEPDNIARVAEYNGDLLLLIVWCEGEVDAVEKVYSDAEEITPVANYTGTASQTGDPTIAAAFGQADDLPDICYSVIRLQPGQSLNLRAVIRGRKVYDPRGPSTAYSQNAALCLADFIDQYTDYNVNWSSVEAAADYCDEIITGATKRWEIGFQIRERRAPGDWIKVLSEYANCYVFVDNGAATLVPDAPGVASLTLTAGDMVKGSFSISKLSQRNSPTQVITNYYLPDATDNWNDENEPAVDPETADYSRVTELRMPGYFRAIHAKRKAVQALNRANNEDITISFDTFEKGIKLTKGDIIAVTHPYGLSLDTFRVLSITAAGRERYRVQARKYSESTYSDDVVTDPETYDSQLPDPLNVPDGPTPTVSEVLWSDEGGKWYSVFEIEFTGSDWPYLKDYRVKVSTAGGVFYETPVNALGPITHTIVTPPVKQDVEYTVEIWATSNLGALSETPGSVTITGNGKAIVPTNVNQSTLTGLEFGQVVWLQHDSVADIDLRGYRWKRISSADYVAAGSAVAAWSHANVVKLADRHDSTQIQIMAQPVGDWLYGVVGVDSVGQESVTPAWVAVTVTADNAGSISTETLDAGTASNMHEYENFGASIGGNMATSARSTDSLEDRFGLQSAAWPVDQTEPFNYGFTFASSIESAAWDTGADITGNWGYSASVAALGGATVVKELLTSLTAAYPTFTTHTGQAVQAESRYVKSKCSVAATANYGFTVRFPVDFSFQGNIQNETITVNVPVSPQPHSFSWTKSFTSPPDFSYVAIGSEPLTVAFDNVDKDGGDVRVWAGAGHSSITAGNPCSATLQITATGS